MIKDNFVRYSDILKVTGICRQTFYSHVKNGLIRKRKDYGVSVYSLEDTQAVLNDAKQIKKLRHQGFVLSSIGRSKLGCSIIVFEKLISNNGIKKEVLNGRIYYLLDDLKKAYFEYKKANGIKERKPIDKAQQTPKKTRLTDDCFTKQLKHESQGLNELESVFNAYVIGKRNDRNETR